MNAINQKHVDACRFCWMCRHICPIGNATGSERNTARGRALGLSLVNRGTYDISAVADNLYECACCGACTKECVTGWDPVSFTRAARLDAALQSKTPAYIMKLVEACLTNGNAYGKKTFGGTLAAAIADHTVKTDTLLYLGVDARYMMEENAVNAIRALEKAGIPFGLLDDEPASGAQLEFLIGAADETRQQMTRCAAVLNRFKTIIVYDPFDTVTFKRTYGEWGIGLTASVVTYTEILARQYKKGVFSLALTTKRAVCQDNFCLARDLGETEPLRILAGARYRLTEMLMHGRDTMWAGNLLMAEWMPDVMRRVAENRIANAQSVGADTIVCASVSEYASLKRAATTDMQIVSVESLLLDEGA